MALDRELAATWQLGADWHETPVTLVPQHHRRLVIQAKRCADQQRNALIGGAARSMRSG
eukprot:CAMPEP_0205944258 /NCGR_PEP_ID=MMETSP1325-20131115/62732_1 /ASSEMBLY_ACC=CAM_ASM_000708 /TAXON_ID=236786 /ORGANISM="Florenciella sp., Strain RCC1007" /LENGTH=58 /DNA_ID=CAMNT_0053315137 /DNA_START=29 /DNA_END=202 /DNA_ORIENTATION=+